MPEIGEIRSKLSEALHRMKDAEKGIMRRASKLWDSSLHSKEDIDNLLTEVEVLVSAFENSPNDLEDLQLMRKALRSYQNVYGQLNDDQLLWSEFKALARNLEVEAQKTLGEDELPWSPEDVINSLVKVISKRRTEASSAWIQSIEEEAILVATMAAAEANRLHARADNPPATLTETHANRLSKIVNDVETRLNALKIDWLVEKFKELSPTMRQEFLSKVSESLGVP
jgi:hypothetical protein